jgi:hypothetical protein
MNSYGGILEDGRVLLKRESKKISEYIQKDGIVDIITPPGSYVLSIELDNEEISKQNIEIKGDKNVNIITSKDSSLHNIFTYFGIIVIFLSVVLILWKKNMIVGLKLITVGLIILAILQPWWILSGEDGLISTSTSTYLIPSKIITTTSTQSIFGGEISLVPEEFTMILELISLILIFSVVIIFLQIFIHKRFRKINFILTFLSTIFLLISFILFYIAMSEVTKVGVGSFSGEGILSISIPGLQDNVNINCNWGFGMGLYVIILSIVANIGIFLPRLKDKIKKFFF